MAVYKRSYRAYDGAMTPQASRFLVIPRYALASLFDSRPLLSFYLTCFFPTVLCIAMIYFVHSPTAQAMLNMQNMQNIEFLTINGFYFSKYLVVQGVFCFLLTAWVGPGLISVDLSNDALPLYLARPFSRAEYLLGKFVVLALLLSSITWVPGLLLFALKSSLAGWGWFAENYWIAGALFLGSWIWIIVLSLLVLAISAWVKWRIAATALMLGLFFVTPGFGEAFNEVMRTHWGKLANMGYLIGRVWADLFRVASPARTGGLHLVDVPVWSAWLMLIGIAIASLLLLQHRLKAREVVR